MDRDQLRAFVVLAREKRFTEAAKRLSTSQPTLSRRVQSLEHELGARLVVRGPSGIVLTGAGARFLPQAENALASIDAGVAALDELATEPSGLVAIGAQHTVGAYVLPAVLAAFHERTPAVRLRIIEGLPPELEERLAGGEIDLALLNLPVRRVDLTAQKLWQEDYVLAVPPQHRFATARRTTDTKGGSGGVLSARPSIALTDAAEEPLVVIPGTLAAAALEAACAERGLVPRIVVEVDNLETARRMVERGVGVALLPRIVAQSHAEAPAERKERFVAIEIGRGSFKRQVALVHRGDAYLSAGARALRAMLVEKLAVRKR